MKTLLKVKATMLNKDTVTFDYREYNIKSENKTIVVELDEYGSTSRIKELGKIDTIFEENAMFFMGRIMYRTWCRPEQLEEIKLKLKCKCESKVKEFLEVCKNFETNFKWEE